jgi:hypothetical protein
MPRTAMLWIDEETIVRGVKSSSAPNPNERNPGSVQFPGAKAEPVARMPLLDFLQDGKWQLVSACPSPKADGQLVVIVRWE